MKRTAIGLATQLGVIGLLAWGDVKAQEAQPDSQVAADVDHRVMEGYPEALLASIEQRNRTLREALESGRTEGAESVIFVSSKWPQNQVVTVAFLDGDKQLHEKVAKAAEQWNNYCNLKLDFGRDPPVRRIPTLDDRRPDASGLYTRFV